jgi:nitrogen fixation/metabolism regulation signal transduction histidine kinase
MTDKSRDLGLMGQIGRNFIYLIIVAGLIVGGIAYTLLGRILREQHDQRAALITINLSDAAAGYIMSRDVLQLNVLLTKYARLNGVAYAFVKDRHGRVIAHSSSTLSSERQESPTTDQRGQVSRRMATVEGKAVYEIQAPILEGQLGTAHLGVWADPIESQVYRALGMLMWPIAVVLLLAAIVAIFLARRLIRPFRRLTDVAGRISSGDLDTPVRVESQHEFGELTRSLERMRASLKAATVRLSGSKASEMNT